MSNKKNSLQDLLLALFNPKATDADIDQAINGMIQSERDAGLPPLAERPKNKKDVCALLAQQSAETSLKELEYYLDHYYKSIEVAKLVARHPNVGKAWLARFMHYLPTDAQQNPQLETHQQAEDWDELVAQKPDKAEPKYWGYHSLRRHYVDDQKPHAFKVHYWLTHGTAADKRYVVGLNKVNEDWVRPFAKDKSAHVRKALAKRKKISPELADALVTDRAKTIRQALADNPSCPAAILTKLSQDPEATVREAALANKACPADAIHTAKLAAQMQPKAADKAVDQMQPTEVIQLLGDANCTPEQLQALSKLNDDYVRAGVALHRNCPPELLAALAKDSSSIVKQAVAFNPNTATAVLQDLLDSGDDSCLIGLASNPSLTEAQQLVLVDKGSDQLRLMLADTTDSVVVWTALRDSEPTAKPKKSKKKTWRECLALCLDPKGKGLYALQRSCDYRYHFVNKLVARHPKCPDSLKKHYAFYDFSSLAQNPQVALLLLEDPNAIKAVEYAEWKVKDWLMYSEVPGHVIKYYLNNNHVQYARKGVTCWTAQLVDIQPHVFDEDIHIKKNIAGLTNCTRFMFEILARDSKESVRAAVVANPQCPPEVLALLHADKVASIRISAQSHRNFKASLSNNKTQSKRLESLKNKGPKRNRIKQAKDTKSLEVLRDLAGDKVAEVRLNVIKNKKCPTDVLMLLKDDVDAEIRRHSAYHPNGNLDICRHLFKDEDDQVRYRAVNTCVYQTAKKPTPIKGQKSHYDDRIYDEKILQQFKADPYEQLRALVARLTRDVASQQAFTADDSNKVREALAGNRHLDQQLAMSLVAQGERAVVRKLAAATTDPDVFQATLTHGDVVADNLWRNHDMCELLVNHQAMVAHSNGQVRKVAAQYAKDAEVLQKCAVDPDPQVREYAAYNEKLRVSHLEDLLNGASESIMSAMHSGHEKFLQKRAADLSAHKNPFVRAYVANNFKLPKDCVERLVKDEAVAVRRALADSYSNNLSEALIEQLRNDPDETVRRYIKWRYE